MHTVISKFTFDGTQEPGEEFFIISDELFELWFKGNEETVFCSDGAEYVVVERFKCLSDAYDCLDRLYSYQDRQMFIR